MCILIIDDDPAIREMLMDTLDDEGFVTAVAGDGDEALAYLKQNAERPCLILLDLMMPRMDGWQFLQERKAFPELATIPVVILSARPDGAEQAHKLCVTGYIPKPIDHAQLVVSAQRYCIHNVLSV